MKFHCDRCKTKYSISDDRVRGKILKIRCKNCSAVITVREGGAAAQKPAATEAVAEGPNAKAAQEAGQKALAGAFKKSVNEVSSDPGHSGSSAPPVSLEAEWYLSIDGEQEGPFSLQDAREWVQTKAADDELHCWSEGYDDWLPVDKVSHFRTLRRAPSPALQQALHEAPTVPSGPGVPNAPGLQAVAPQAVAPRNEDTPVPLFAATMAAVEKRSNGSETPAKAPTGPFDSVPQAQPRAASAPPIPVAAKPSGPKPTAAPAMASSANEEGFNEEGPSLEFDIGEASRVVDLPALLASRGNAPVRPAGGIHRPAGLPGMAGEAASLGRGSGVQSTIPAAESLRNGTAPAVALMGATPVGSVDLEPNSELLQPASRKRRGGLHLPLIAVGLLIAGVAVVMILTLTGGDGESEIARGTVGGSGNLGYSFEDTRRPRSDPGTPDVQPDVQPKTTTKTRKGNTGSGKTNNTTTKVTPLPRDTGPSDEVDLGSGTETGPTGPLDGDDLMKVYRRNQIAIKMCYERELKKNPLLKLPKTWVDIKVGLDGRVSGVTISSLSGTPLGSCMRSRIARWKFRKTTETFSSRFPVVFGS